jgi:hypothetical protein
MSPDKKLKVEGEIFIKIATNNIPKAVTRNNKFRTKKQVLLPIT